jgi:hypothetical protein
MSNTKEIQLVQGDSLTLSLTFEDIESSDIQAIYFSSKGVLNFAKEFSEDGDNYILTIAAEDSEDFSRGHFTYDITVEFTENRKKTVIYKGPFVILSKDNKIHLEE